MRWTGVLARCVPVQRSPPRGLTVVVAVVSALSAARVYEASASLTAFRNPIAPLRAGEPGSPGLDSPDPWIFTFRGRYYLTTTAGPQIVLRSASEIGGLASAGARTVWPPPRMRMPRSRCCGFWAPEFHRLLGPSGWRWYVYSAADDGDLVHHHLQVLESAHDDPAGPYRFKAVLKLGPDYEIDPTVFVLRGHEYLIYSDAPPNLFFPAHLSLAELRDPWTVQGAPIAISTPTSPWERTGFAIEEGPEVLFHGPFLHVIYSAGHCSLSTYSLGRLTVRASEDVLDPRTWAGAKYAEPVFSSDPASGVWGTGHGSFFTSPDGTQDWQVYHAIDNPAFGCTTGFRTTRAQPFTWNADGTPNFGRPVPLTTDLDAPSGDPTFERQFEDAPVITISAALSRRLRDANFVGEAGTVIRAARRGAVVEYAASVPVPRRYRILVRMGTGPDRPAVTLIVSSGPRVWRLRTVHPGRTRPGVAEADFGSAELAAGPMGLRFVFDAPGAVKLDEVRLDRPAPTGARP